MKFSTNKTKATAISFVLVLTIAISLTFLPTVNAEVRNYTSYVYCSVGNRVIGVNQQVLLVMWTADIPPDIGEIAGTVPGGRAAWYNIGFYVTDPEGNKETITVAKSDPVGSGWVNYTPDKIGTYTIQAWFPETWKNTTTSQRHYSAAVSPETTFTVQEEPIEPWTETPLPTGYWSRPINSANRDWYVLAGNWLAGASGGGGASINTPFLSLPGTYGGVPQQLVHCYGPTSAHILWTKPYFSGGIMDEQYGATGYQTATYGGLSWTGVIIMQGKMYYAPRTTAHGTSGYDVVDLYTGETLYEENNTKPAFGQIYNYESPNQHGGFQYLWITSGVTLPEGDISRSGTSTWQMLDGYTRNPITIIANVSASTGRRATGKIVYGKDGSILYYDLVNYGTTEAPDYYLTVWNSSAIPSLLTGIPPSSSGWQWRPARQAVHDGDTGFSVNVSIPSPYGPRNSLLNETGTIRCIRQGDYMIIATSGRNDERGKVPGMILKVSLKRDETLGKEISRINFDEPYAPTSANASNTIAYILPESNVFVCGYTGMQGGSKTLVWYGYDLTTGKQIWETDTQPQFQYYVGRWDTYNGLLIQQGYGGVLLAYNATTGKQAWNYTATNVGFESPYGNYPIGISCIADGNGLIYTTGSEHSPTQPLWRGPNLRCINATDGTEVWSILFWGAGMAPTDPSNVAMADGILVGLDYFDNELYAFGKGPSATTLEAPLTAVPLGSSIMLTGTVTDDTPTGRRNTNYEIDFTLKGTPAICDEDMGAWMEYMFMQQVYPEDAKGVTVKLTAIDPNGNFQDIGEVTSDISGSFGKSWTPPVPGEYHVTATFEGSASYGSSSATAYFVVGEAPAAAQPIEPEEPTQPEPTEPAPTEPEPTEPEEPEVPTEPEEPTEPEPTEPIEAPLLITTDLAIIAAVAVAAVIGIAAYWQLRKRK